MTVSTLAIMSELKRFIIVDDSFRNRMVPCLLPREIVNKYGGAEVRTYDGV